MTKKPEKSTEKIQRREEKNAKENYICKYTEWKTEMMLNDMKLEIRESKSNQNNWITE